MSNFLDSEEEKRFRSIGIESRPDRNYSVRHNATKYFKDGANMGQVCHFDGFEVLKLDRNRSKLIPITSKFTCLGGQLELFTSELTR